MEARVFIVIRRAFLGISGMFRSWLEERRKEERDREYLMSYFRRQGLDIRI